MRGDSIVEATKSALPRRMAKNVSLRVWASFPQYFAKVATVSLLGAKGSNLRARMRMESIEEITGLAADDISKVWEEACSIQLFREASTSLDRYGLVGRFSAARELFTIVRLLKPKRVIETGVGAGFSSLHFLEALKRNGEGQLYSIDLPNADPTFRLPSGLPPGFLVPSDLRSRWDLRLGPTLELLPALLGSLTDVDMFFHDSGHDYNNMLFELNSVFPKVKPGGLIIIDDTISNTAALDFSRAVKDAAIPLFDGGILHPSSARLILAIRK
jgi:predicted O-methyltransferase YrrM